MDATRRTLDPIPTELLSGDVLADLHVTLLYVDADLRVLAHTAGLEPYLAGAGSEPTGMGLPDVFPELAGIEGELVAVARGESPRFDLPMVNRLEADGVSRRYFSLAALPHPKTPGRLVLLVRDVTSEGRLGQQVMQQLNEVRLLRSRLEAANTSLVQLNEEKSAFLRMAAHDLRAPLAIIQGYVELVLATLDAAQDEESAGHLQLVLKRATQMAHLIDSLLDIERIESGEVSLEFAPLDLAELVRQVAHGFLPLAREKGLALSWEIPAKLPIVADADRLAQVFNNLLSNALKFTPAGGEVCIDARQAGDRATVTVSDTGPGISADDQARLFQRFFRTADSRRRQVAGTGLGLSIARAIVEQHGGQISCHSRLGQGSTFSVTLPLTGA